ncbi:MAG: HAMP domain-containing histidine kinase [Elusimicrobia bacterium]|nr:HAMP domain-containing histidine kinase [Elusimicrobiota bacterium]
MVERLAYVLVLSPFLASYLVRRGAAWTAPAVAADVAVAAVILAFVLLMRRTRRLTQKINNLRKTMSEAIIHDLKNPMTAVMGCLSCAISEDVDPKRLAALLGVALHSCRVQMSLLETLVDTSRLENGELSLHKKNMRLRDLLDNCIKDIQGTACHLGIELKSDIPESIPGMIVADPDLLPRAIYNLMHNALKYSASHGVVSLRVSFRDEAFHFEIGDTGIGIGPDHIDRIFKKYYRVEGTSQIGRRGSGLGLYFCRLVVEAHGGTIGVSSEMGRGTSITFTIPQPARIGEARYDTIRGPVEKDKSPV